MAVIFDKNSTRTRFSFEIGIAQLGGHAVVVDGRSHPARPGGNARGHRTGAVALRRRHRMAHVRPEAVDRHGLGVPPCPSSTRCPTSSTRARSSPTCRPLAERKGIADGLRMTYFGDGANNMAHSLMLGGVDRRYARDDRRPGRVRARPAVRGRRREARRAAPARR